MTLTRAKLETVDALLTNYWPDDPDIRRDLADAMLADEPLPEYIPQAVKRQCLDILFAPAEPEPEPEFAQYDLDAEFDLWRDALIE